MNIAVGQNYNYFDTSFYSPVLDETKSMRIYLPPGYEDDTTTYPIVYYLHGAYGSYADVIQIMQRLQSMIDIGYIHPLLLVGLDGQCDPFAGSMYTNSVLYGDYEDYIIQEAIPFAESVVRTKNSPNYRCIMGFAMGAYGSMKLALKYPELFAGIASYNGPLQFDTTLVLWQPEILAENPGTPYHFTYGAGIFTNLVFTGAGGFSPNLSILPYQVEFPYDTMGIIVDSVFQKWKQHDCSRLAKDLEPNSYHPGLFIACGVNDFLYFHPTNVCFADTLDDLGIDYEFLTTDDGHVLSDEILEAGMYFLDSTMHDDYWIGNIEIEEETLNILTVYPNPCSGRMKILYHLPDHGRVVLKLYDLLGREVMDVVNANKRPGKHMEETDSKDLPAGVYLVILTAGYHVACRKIIIQ